MTSDDLRWTSHEKDLQPGGLRARHGSEHLVFHGPDDRELAEWAKGRWPFAAYVTWTATSDPGVGRSTGAEVLGGPWALLILRELLLWTEARLRHGEVAIEDESVTPSR